MADITAQAIPGCTVYGLQQVEYLVDGTVTDYGGALALASVSRALRLEGLTAALAGAMRLRMRKLEDLGKALAEIVRASATVQNVDEQVTGFDASKVGELLARYGLKIEQAGSKLTKGDLLKTQTNVQYAADREKNWLQQDTSTVQTLYSRRDQAMKQASTIARKATDAADYAIGEMRK